MRSKEDAHDYRYFPDPDILPLTVSEQSVKEIKSRLAEPPQNRYARYTKEFQLSARDAETLLVKRPIADFFDAVTARCEHFKSAANAIKGELLRCVNEAGREEEAIAIDTGDFIKAIEMAAQNEITQDGLKTAIACMYTEGADLETVLAREKLIIKEDTALIESVIQEVLATNPESVVKYKSGNEKIFSYLIGQCMKQLKGKALPVTIQSKLRKALEG
jgi:aspartyl-tRNA(Asn)/glutamyl-tRNA(Gln) amidotransferase subunit B